jgi:hypothetical protein
MYLVRTLTQGAKKASVYSLSAVLAFSALLLVFYNDATAAQLSQAMVRFDSMKISTGTTGTVCAKPATTAAEASVQVVFPTGYALGAAGTFTVNTTNLAWPATATAWLGINTATNVTSQTVTFPSTDLAVGTLYCFNWTNTAAVQVKSSASASNSGTITTRDSVPATIDTASYSTASIASDQIDVTASVAQSFSFALSGNTDALGALTSGSVTTSPTPRTVTVNTNSASGWSVWAKDANTGLDSNATGTTISSIASGAGNNLTLSAGSEGYNFGVTSSQTGGTGSITVAAGFVGTAAGQGGVLDTSLRTVASSNGTANNAVLTLKNNAAISATTAAATDYADTITVVGAGLF